MYSACWRLLIMAVLLLLNGGAEEASFELIANHPADGQRDVRVSASLHLQFSQPVDVESLKHLTVHQIVDGDAHEVKVRRATDLTNASITLSPAELLEPSALYEVRASGMLKSREGVPLKSFQYRFETAFREPEVDPGLLFKMQRFDRSRSMTTILFGPDRRLYAADAFGTLVRWDISSDGSPVNKQVLLTDPKKSRQYIDLEWDPQATTDNLILWVSYGERLAPKDERHFFTGTIARFLLHNEDGVEQQPVVTGLPHGREKQGGFDTLPHQPNGLVFRDGKLYQSVGSTSSSGGPPNWGLPEQLLSGCILEIDVDRIDEPLDVHPNTGYDPYAPDAPVRIFATGIRNALEIVAHTNDHLYTATNINDRRGSADGVPDHPEIAGNQNLLIKQTTPDHESLYLLRRGRHYGFPNPARQQYVLNGGNPTAGEDPYEIADYPVGTQPEEGFAPELSYPLWQYGGTSPNGMIEYLPDFPHPLRHVLLCCFYSAGDIAAIFLGEDGMPTSVQKLRGPNGKHDLQGPLDITMDPQSGILYIADFGTQSKFGVDGSVVLLRPLVGPDE